MGSGASKVETTPRRAVDSEASTYGYWLFASSLYFFSIYVV